MRARSSLLISSLLCIVLGLPLGAPAAEGDQPISTNKDKLLTLAVPQASQRLSEIFAALSEAQATVRETTLTQPNLESLFIKLTGRELRE